GQLDAAARRRPGAHAGTRLRTGLRRRRVPRGLRAHLDARPGSLGRRRAQHQFRARGRLPGRGHDMSMAPRVVRVLIADDHASTRADVRKALDADARFEVCAEMADAPGAVQAAVRERPDVCLLDISMPGGGLSAAWEIAARLPRAKIVILTVSSEDADLFAAL